MSHRICVYPGSFDPVTLGHLDIIRRCAGLYDEVIVAITVNPAKRGCFPIPERLEMLRQCLDDLPNVRVMSFEGLTVAFARRMGACAMVRGLRNTADFEQERALAQVNRSIAPELETVFLMSRPEHGHISSSAVREMAAYGADLTGYVPDKLISTVQAHFQSNQE